MRTVQFTHSPAADGCLVVFLPGIRNGPESFARHGFTTLAADAGLQCDMMAVDSNLAYFREHSLVQRLEQDVLQPARARGYRRVWFVGTSLGALATLLFDERRPGELAGMLLLGPYLGEPATRHEIEAAGGLRRWTPPQGGRGESASFEAALWSYIKNLGDPATRRPPVYLGFGDHDRYADAQRLLASQLPPEDVFVVHGGHDWKSWREVWTMFLQTEVLPRGERAMAGRTP